MPSVWSAATKFPRFTGFAFDGRPLKPTTIISERFVAIAAESGVATIFGSRGEARAIAGEEPLRTKRAAANRRRARLAIARAEAFTRRVHRHAAGHRGRLPERCFADSFLVHRNCATPKFIARHG